MSIETKELMKNSHLKVSDQSIAGYNYKTPVAIMPSSVAVIGVLRNYAEVLVTLIKERKNANIEGSNIENQVNSLKGKIDAEKSNTLNKLYNNGENQKIGTSSFNVNSLGASHQEFWKSAAKINQYEQEFRKLESSNRYMMFKNNGVTYKNLQLLQGSNKENSFMQFNVPSLDNYVENQNDNLKDVLSSNLSIVREGFAEEIVEITKNLDDPWTLEDAKDRLITTEQLVIELYLGQNMSGDARQGLDDIIYSHNKLGGKYVINPKLLPPENSLIRFKGLRKNILHSGSGAMTELRSMNFTVIQNYWVHFREMIESEVNSAAGSLDSTIKDTHKYRSLGLNIFSNILSSAVSTMGFPVGTVLAAAVKSLFDQENPRVTLSRYIGLFAKESLSGSDDGLCKQYKDVDWLNADFFTQTPEEWKSTKDAKSNYDKLLKNWQFRKDQYYAKKGLHVKPEDYEKLIDAKPKEVEDNGANGGGDKFINTLYKEVQPYIGNPLKLIKTERDEIKEIGPALAGIRKGKFSFVKDDRKKPENIKGKKEKIKHAARETYDQIFIKGVDMRRIFRMHRPATEKVPEIKEMGKVFDGFIKTVLDNFYESFLDTMAITYEGRKVTSDLIGTSAYYKIEHASELLDSGIDNELLSCCKRYYNSINLFFLKLVKSSFTPNPLFINNLHAAKADLALLLKQLMWSEYIFETMTSKRFRHNADYGTGICIKCTDFLNKKFNGESFKISAPGDYKQIRSNYGHITEEGWNAIETLKDSKEVIDQFNWLEYTAAKKSDVFNKVLNDGNDPDLYDAPKEVCKALESLGITFKRKEVIKSAEKYERIVNQVDQVGNKTGMKLKDAGINDLYEWQLAEKKSIENSKKVFYNPYAFWFHSPLSMNGKNYQHRIPYTGGGTHSGNMLALWAYVGKKFQNQIIAYRLFGFTPEKYKEKIGYTEYLKEFHGTQTSTSIAV